MCSAKYINFNPLLLWTISVRVRAIVVQCSVHKSCLKKDLGLLAGSDVGTTSLGVEGQSVSQPYSVAGRHDKN